MPFKQKKMIQLFTEKKPFRMCILIFAQNMKNNKTYLHTLIMLSLGLEKSCIIDKQTQNRSKRMEIPADKRYSNIRYELCIN